MTSRASSAKSASSRGSASTGPRKVIIQSKLALGDIVCMTAAIEELHRQHPGEFITDVRTAFADLWQCNPHITPIPDGEGQLIDLHYDRDQYVSVHQSNQHTHHMIDAYCHHLGAALGVGQLRPNARPQRFEKGELKLGESPDPYVRGRIYLSDCELRCMSIPHERYNVQKYWLISAGGKYDFPLKLWPAEHWQAVIDHFRGRLQFVQIGVDPEDDFNHLSPDLRGVIDLRGKTTVRQLIHLVHASCGVVSGITALMHLAAAVPTPGWQSRPRPCVVIAGGREPRAWYSYPTHRVLDTVGALPCCATGGCWHSHAERDRGNPADARYCERVVSGYPKCQWMIRPAAVIDAIEQYLEGLTL